MARPGTLRLALPAVLAALLAALPGCATAGAAASVRFDGTGSGVDEDHAHCGGRATLTATGLVEDGRLVLRVLSGGEELLRETYAGDVAVDGRALEGPAGEWTLEATRSGGDLLADFAGEYRARLDC